MNSQRAIKIKLLVIQLIAIIPLLLFIFYIFDLWFDVRRSIVLENTINQGRLISQTVEESFKLGTHISTIVATNPGFKSLIEKDPSIVESTLRTITDNIPEISGINISNTSGKSIFMSREISKEQKDQTSLADRNYFQKVIETQKPAISGILTNKFRDTQGIVMAAPIIDKGKVTAVVGSFYEMEALKAKMDSVLPLDDKYTVLLYDQDGRLALILHKALPNDAEKTVFNNLPFLAKYDSHKVNIVENEKLPNSTKTYLGAMLPVDGYGWTVVNLISQDDVFAPIYKVQKITWLIILSALIFALSLISYVLRKIKMVY